MQTQMGQKQIQILKDQKVATDNELVKKTAELVLTKQTEARLTTEISQLSWVSTQLSGHILEIETSLLLLQKAIWKSSD